MKYEQFLKLVMSNKALSDMYSELYDMGFDFFEGKYKLVEHSERITDVTFSLIYDEEGIDWLNWFMYENEYGEGNLIASDKDGNSICYSYESLWEYLEKNHKLIG